MLLYALTIFLSAFLLFQVEPIIAKIILPWFGGSAAVWTTCLLFFQIVLLLGYLYAHAVQRLSPRKRARLHVLLLLVSLLALPIVPKNSWRPVGGEEPAFRILLLLAATVGLPYFLLSATSPLLQAWYAADRPGGRPYRLFALSNAGSMLGLVSYPVLVEPFITTRHQAVGWSLAYACLAVLCGAVALRKRGDLRSADPSPTESRPSRGTLFLWIGLAACGSAFLFGVTNHLSQNVAAVPFLWVLPLSLYLVSFILCFEGRRWYARNIFLQLFAVALGGMAYALSPDFANSSLRLLIPLYSVGLFICCMVCHGELERLKPRPERLTSFYLMVSLGGALGGVFVGLLAPRLFSGYFELPVTMGASAAVLLVVLRRDPSSVFHGAWWKPAWVIAIVLAAALAAYLVVQVRQQTSESRVMVRNFYGSLRVIDTDEPDLEHARRKLVNGTIQHGSQFLEAHRRDVPTTYYGPQSGVGLALHEAETHRNIRVGVIGLGVGTLAAYGRPGDRYTFYEINPLVIQLAKAYFTFLKDSKATTDIVLGDARLSLEREPPQGFDVLAVDAFTSDSIPVHLLTRESFQLYFRHLKPGGVLAVHVSNRYLDLLPVVEGIADSMGKPAMQVASKKDEDKGDFAATWALVTDRSEFFDEPEIDDAADPLEDSRKRMVWTDDYSNLFRTLK